MKSNSISLMDLLTIILFVPFCLVVLAGTGLALVVAIDLDQPETARAAEITRPRIRRYIVLPPVTPAPTEPAEAVTDPPEHAAQVVDAGPEETQVEPALVEPPAVEAETAVVTAPVEDTADAANAQDDIPDPAEVAEPADLALADPELPDATDEEALVDEMASPPVTTPVEEPAPVEPDPPPPPPPPPPTPTPQPPPREPAPVPDVSFFDDLLDQVK